MPVEIALPLAIFLVLLNGFFVAAEFALVKVRQTKIIELVNKGRPTARMALHAIQHLDAYLAATQLGITLSSIGLGWIGEPAVAVLLNPLFETFQIPERFVHGISFAVAFTLISMAHIIFGELAPKSWAIQRPDKLSLAVAYPLHWFYWLFKPAIWSLNGIANRFLRIVGIRPASDAEMAHGQEELDLILTASLQSGVLKASEVDLVKHIFRFADKNVADIMVPRTDVVFMQADWSPQQALNLAMRHPYSRYPLIDRNPDEVIGMVHLRDIVKLERRRTGTLAEVARNVIVVPLNKPLDELLREFQKAKTHIAIVADEYGGTAGIATLEDVLEQIVGHIEDESDITSIQIEPLPNNTWRVAGTVRLQDLNEALGAHFESEHVDTIGGFVVEAAGKVPKRGEQIHLNGWNCIVTQADGRRVRRIELQAPNASHNPTQE